MDEPWFLSVSKQKQRPGEPIVWVAVHEPIRSGSLSIAARGTTEAEARANVREKALALINDPGAVKP